MTREDIRCRHVRVFQILMFVAPLGILCEHELMRQSCNTGRSLTVSVHRKKSKFVKDSVHSARQAERGVALKLSRSDISCHRR